MSRLYLNKGRYHGETLDIREYLREFDEAARKRGWSAETFGQFDGFDFCGYRRSVGAARRTVYISTGIHGDEPAGPVALRRLIEEDQWPGDTNFILTPCLNPAGFANNTRENAQGIDLNRDYREPQAPSTIAHIAWLNQLPRLDLSLILHEDWEADGYYVYELSPDGLPAPGQRIIEAVREVCPVQATSKIDNLWDCVDGIIRPDLPPAERPLWAESLYLIVNKTRLSLTLEAPSDYPLAFRAEAHVRAVRAGLA